MKMFNQNDGEVKFLEVHVVDNDDNSITNVWSLSAASSWAPVLGSWQEGRVKINPEHEEKEYQVICEQVVQKNRALLAFVL